MLRGRSSLERAVFVVTPRINGMLRKKKLSPISLLIAAIALTIVVMAGTLGNYENPETVTVGGSAVEINSTGGVVSGAPSGLPSGLQQIDADSEG
jgi:hypothetical protein